MLRYHAQLESIKIRGRVTLAWYVLRDITAKILEQLILQFVQWESIALLDQAVGSIALQVLFRVLLV